MASEATITITKMIETLPEQLKDQVAEHLRDYIEDLRDETRWNNSFSRSKDKLIAAARQVRKEISGQGLKKYISYGVTTLSTPLCVSNVSTRVKTSGRCG